nr:Chain A, De novo mini protein HHH_06 [synthetic construct]
APCEDLKERLKKLGMSEECRQRLEKMCKEGTSEDAERMARNCES